MRLRWIPLALMMAAAPAYGFTFTSGPDSTSACQMGRGASCFADVTASGTGAQSTSACAKIAVRVFCNTASATDHDCTVVAWACPAGTTTADPLVCRMIPYQDINGSSQTELNGDVSTWREALESTAPQNLVTVVTTVGQTTRVQVDCR